MSCENVKITIGGRSHNRAPKLMSDPALTKALGGRLTLIDVDPQPLSLMVELGQHMMAELCNTFPRHHGRNV